MNDFHRLLRSLPSVDRVLGAASLVSWQERCGHQMVRDATRQRLELLRQEILTGKLSAVDIAARAAGLPGAVQADLEARVQDPYPAVINATGILVHTNLGRAPLADRAREAAWRAAGRALALEYDVAAGQRGSRGGPVRAVLEELFPSFTGLAVNNNAAAVLLALNSLARDGEVLISRGELVEIGGSFRVPDILERSGAVLVEVGTTNRTRAADFRAALGPRSAAILRVHPSNFEQLGFIETTPVTELAAIAREANVPLIVDQGSGNLHDLSACGVVDEPTVGALLAAGADAVTFSGDKLLGGPQAGLVVGRPEIVARLASNPLARALRPDKMILASLVETLRIHREGRALAEIPVLRRLSAPVGEIAARAAALCTALTAAGVDAAGVRVQQGTSRTGGGSSPGSQIETVSVVIEPDSSVTALAERLRRQQPAVVARIANGCLLVDFRSVDPEEDALLCEGLVRALASDPITR